MDTRTRILKEIHKHIGEIGIYGLELVRLIGFKEDDDDYYYYVQSLRYNRVQCNSCVGRIIWLKHLPKRDYQEIERMFKLNYFGPDK